MLLSPGTAGGQVSFQSHCTPKPSLLRCFAKSSDARKLPKEEFGVRKESLGCFSRARSSENSLYKEGKENVEPQIPEKTVVGEENRIIKSASLSGTSYMFA